MSAKTLQPSSYVCCKSDLEDAKSTVMDVDGPNAVYCKDDNCIYYHRKPLVARIKEANNVHYPQGDVAREILKAMGEARKINPNVQPTLVRL